MPAPVFLCHTVMMSYKSEHLECAAPPLEATTVFPPAQSREEARPTPSLNCHRGDIPLDVNPPRHLYTFPLAPLPSMSYGKKDEDADLGLVKVDRSQVFQEGLSLAIASSTGTRRPANHHNQRDSSTAPQSSLDDAVSYSPRSPYSSIRASRFRPPKLPPSSSESPNSSRTKMPVSARWSTLSSRSSQTRPRISSWLLAQL